jgi:tRNA (adenine57-N1/adenine58-N1)-methyltransferase
MQIYPADANLIVSLLDLHPSAAEDAESLNILEAGTGHGALTLHLSRAIHAANAQKPKSTRLSEVTEDAPATESSDDTLAIWKASRKAVIHTIDISAKYSKHASKVVAGFRHGFYAGNVDFHVGDVSEWIKSEMVRRDSEDAFLTHAFLDLPATQNHLSAAACALKNDAILIIFNPSITQIVDCVQKIKQEGIPLFLDQTLELGNNGISGGKAWDLRAVKPRAAPKIQAVEESPDSVQSSTPEASSEEDQSITRDAVQTLTEAKPEDSNWSFVCRPKVGERITGGGFLGVFRKMRNISRP